MLLDALLEQVKAGRGQVVSLVGAPGMGKSRLLDEFRQRLTGQPVRYAEGQCLAYGSVDALSARPGPAAGVLRDRRGRSPRDAACQGARQPPASEPRPRRQPALSPPPAGPAGRGRPARASQRRGPQGADVRGHSAALSHQQSAPPRGPRRGKPALDRPDLGGPAGLARGRAGRGIDPDAGHLPPGYRPLWLDKSYATQIALQPLGPDESRQVVRSVVRDTALTPALEQQLLARAEGNPFFLEELAYTVREHGEGHPALAVPDTIQAVLAARMDRLPTAERHLLQAAAVIGKDIAVSLLQAIAALPEAALQRGLAHLQAAEFLYETRLVPEREYTFKHALTHEVAYGSLLQERRRSLHARIVEALEALAGERVAEQVERLAHHALRGEVWDKAVAYCRQAGEKAMARSAHREAVGSFEQALGALQRLPGSGIPRNKPSISGLTCVMRSTL